MKRIGHSVWLFFGGRRQLERSLRRAAADNEDAIVILTLIDMGARVDAPDPETGHTPLIIAVEHGCRSVLVALLSHGADVNARANNGKSALDIAQQKDTGEIAKLLEDAHQAYHDYDKP